MNTPLVQIPARFHPARRLAGALAAALLAIGAVTAARADFSISFGVNRPPPAPRYEQAPPPPGPGFVWVHGYWGESAGQYVWIPGRWERPAGPGEVWVQPRWDRDGDRWVFHGGHWGRRDEDDRRGFFNHRDRDEHHGIFGNRDDRRDDDRRDRDEH
jgi:hypothetical protein